MKKVNLNMRLDAALSAKIERKSEATRRTKTSIIEEALERYFEEENMIKFEIIKNAMDSNKDYYEGISLDAVDQLHEIEASFNTEEEALEALKEYESTFEFGRPNNHIVEYFIEVNEYDEEGEWVAGGDIVEFAKLREE